MDDEVKEIARLMAEKGYPRDFSIIPDLRAAGWGPLRCLDDCLSIWLTVDYRDGGARRQLYLACQFYSSLHRENMECRFEFGHREQGGIKISQLRIELKGRFEEKWLRFRDNREVPGFGSIEGLFNRRNPWDDEMRRRFRRH